MTRLLHDSTNINNNKNEIRIFGVEGCFLRMIPYNYRVN